MVREEMTKEVEYVKEVLDHAIISSYGLLAGQLTIYLAAITKFAAIIILRLAIMEAWEYNPSEEDRRLPHRYVPNRPVPVGHLEELGVLHWVIDADKWETDPALQRVKSEQGYIYWETLTVAPGHLEEFEKKSQHFFEEHLHPYEESRLILEGTGYWDIRDYSNKWIRFKVSKGDMITLPPGMYHRFTVDTSDYIKVTSVWLANRMVACFYSIFLLIKS
ncbi:hypothetical protein L7F22_004712 [Adiantum nelumboides]|nr:hypothetical protein [Adiantum nelumboides]